jgi:hypothetical protein
MNLAHIGAVFVHEPHAGIDHIVRPLVTERDRTVVEWPIDPLPQPLPGSVDRRASYPGGRCCAAGSVDAGSRTHETSSNGSTAYTCLPRSRYDDLVVRRIGDPCAVADEVLTVGDAHLFKNGRQFAAWIGTVPKQKSSGGKTRLGRITKQGNTYLRTLLFQGARSAVTSAHRRTDRLSRWIVQLQARVGWYPTLVAVANKHARILWAILARGERFDPSYVSTPSTPGQPRQDNSTNR